MKKTLVTIAAVLLTCFAFSQDFDIKKNSVWIDGKECLKINDSDPNNVSFYDLQGNELFFLKFIHNSIYGSLYTKITFLDQKLSFTSKSYIFTKKLLLKKLLGDNVITDCKLDPAKVERFVLKYDENVERK